MTAIAVTSPLWTVDETTPPLEAALAYGRAGLRVAWIHSPVFEGTEATGCTCGSPRCERSTWGKHPILTAWQRAASSEESELRDQFLRLKKTPNLGIVLGEQAGGEYLIAIDVDDAHRLSTLQTELGELPPTLTGRSARGARMFYRAPTELKNVTAMGGEPGVDVKARGGQVVVAPSLHASGARYVWEYPLSTITDLPSGWVLALKPPAVVPQEFKDYTPATLRDDKRVMRRAEKYLQTAVAAEASQLALTRTGSRNTALHRSLCRLLPLAHGLSLATGHGYVVRECASAAKAAGLSDREVQTTVASAEKWLSESGAVRMPHAISGNPTPSAAPSEEPPAVTLLEDNGQPAKIESNVARMLLAANLSPPFGVPRYDEFSDRIVWAAGRRLVDNDVSEIRGWLFSQSHELRVRASPETVFAGIVMAATQRAFHPVADYLRSLTHDGTPRLDQLFSKFFGADDTAFSRAAAKCFMLGAVARIRQPGCQLDTLPVLEGPQGVRKSTALRVLAGEWFSDTAFVPGDKDSFQSLPGVWIYELAELAALRGRDVERIKAFISSRTDHYRKSYGRAQVDVPRQVAFVGSTNAATYLHDETGNRRYHPIACARIDVEALAKWRDQLWAEAVARREEPWWLQGEVIAEQAAEAEKRRHEDPWHSRVAVLADGAFTVSEVLERLGVEPGNQTRADEMRVAPILRAHGWVRKHVTRLGVLSWFYVR